MGIDRATELGTLGEFAAKTDPMTTHFAVPNLLPESLPKFVRPRPNHAKLPQPVPAKRLKTFNPISSDTFSRPPVSTTHPLLRV